MESYELVEQIEALWSREPIGEVLNFTSGPRLLAELPGYRLLCQVLIGSRGGVRELAVLVDPKPRITADRLVARYNSISGQLLDLAAVRQQHGKQARWESATRELEALYGRTQTRPDEVIGTVRAGNDDFATYLSPDYQAGAPSLGKRRK